MNLARNGWLWFTGLAIVGWWNWPATPDLQHELSLCTSTQAARAAQVDGLTLQVALQQGELNTAAQIIGKQQAFIDRAVSHIQQIQLRCPKGGM